MSWGILLQVDWSLICISSSADGDEEDGTDETIVPVDFKTAGQITDDVSVYCYYVAGVVVLGGNQPLKHLNRK